MRKRFGLKFGRPVVVWTAAGVILGVTGIFLVLHFTPLRFWYDPVNVAADSIRFAAAKTSFQRAEAHLAVAERQLRDFQQLSATAKPDDKRVVKLAQDMASGDVTVMNELHKAEKSGSNIKSLVKRCCDSLEAQAEALKKHNQAVAKPVWDLWVNVESMERARGELHQAEQAVQDGLDKAMEW